MSTGTLAMTPFKYLKCQQGKEEKRQGSGWMHSGIGTHGRKGALDERVLESVARARPYLTVFPIAAAGGRHSRRKSI